MTKYSCFVSYDIFIDRYIDCSNSVGFFISFPYFSAITLIKWSLSANFLNTFCMLIAAWLMLTQLLYSHYLFNCVILVLKSMVLLFAMSKEWYGLFLSGTCFSINLKLVLIYLLESSLIDNFSLSLRSARRLCTFYLSAIDSGCKTAALKV